MHSLFETKNFQIFFLHASNIFSLNISDPNKKLEVKKYLQRIQIKLDIFGKTKHLELHHGFDETYRCRHSLHNRICFWNSAHLVYEADIHSGIPHYDRVHGFRLYFPQRTNRVNYQKRIGSSLREFGRNKQEPSQIGVSNCQ